MPRLLVIDDENLIRMLTREAGEALGYEVLSASSLREGRALLDADAAAGRSLDLVLLDVMLPDGDGLAEMDRRAILMSSSSPATATPRRRKPRSAPEHGTIWSSPCACGNSAGLSEKSRSGGRPGVRFRTGSSGGRTSSETAPRSWTRCLSSRRRLPAA